MPREEHEREDLLAEAKALVERVALRVEGDAEDIVVGFRSGGSASIYFGATRVYQFTSVGQLRRAMVGDLLFKAERGKLVSLRRHRSEQAVVLLHDDLDAEGMRWFWQDMQSCLDKLRGALLAERFTLVGQVPETSDVVGRVRAWLGEFAGKITIAHSPHVV